MLLWIAAGGKRVQRNLLNKEFFIFILNQSTSAWSCEVQLYCQGLEVKLNQGLTSRDSY